LERKNEKSQKKRLSKLCLFVCLFRVCLLKYTPSIHIIQIKPRAILGLKGKKGQRKKEKKKEQANSITLLD